MAPKSVRVRNPEDQFQRDVKSSTDLLNSSPLLNGKVVSANVTTSETRIQHGLGRPVNGFFIVYSTLDVRVWATTQTATYITLQASMDAAVKLWVF